MSAHWIFTNIKTSLVDGLEDAVTHYEARIALPGGELYLGEIESAPPEPDGFIAFPSDPADTPAFEAALKSWAVVYRAEAEQDPDLTAADLEARADAVVTARASAPVSKALP